MKLYHATQADNEYGITVDGIIASGDTSHFGYKRESDVCGVYGFTSIEDAESFAIDNFWFDGVIFALEAGDLECVVDPEYDEGSAYIVIPEGGNIRAEKVKTIEM